MDDRPQSPVVPAVPQVSPDGRFYLEDDRWIPLPARAADRRSIARGVADGIAGTAAKALLALLLFPVVTALAVVAMLALVPASFAVFTIIATVAVCFGLLWIGLRALD